MNADDAMVVVVIDAAHVGTHCQKYNEKCPSDLTQYHCVKNQSFFSCFFSSSSG
jgi:hypothetical protein